MMTCLWDELAVHLLNSPGPLWTAKSTPHHRSYSEIASQASHMFPAKGRACREETFKPLCPKPRKAHVSTIALHIPRQSRVAQYCKKKLFLHTANGGNLTPPKIRHTRKKDCNLGLQNGAMVQASAHRVSPTFWGSEVWPDVQSIGAIAVGA